MKTQYAIRLTDGTWHPQRFEFMTTALLHAIALGLTLEQFSVEAV